MARRGTSTSSYTVIPDGGPTKNFGFKAEARKYAKAEANRTGRGVAIYQERYDGKRPNNDYVWPDRNRQQNPVMPKGKWVKGQVRVTKGGKVEFRKTGVATGGTRTGTRTRRKRNPIGTVQVYLERVHLDRQGYTSSGRYYGVGAPLYHYDYKGTGDRDWDDEEIRANDRTDAKQRIMSRLKKKYPAGYSIVFKR